MNSTTASGIQTAPLSTRNKVANIALWTLQALLAAAFVFGGVNKLFGLDPQVIAGFAKLGGDTMRHLIGILEIAGGIGLLIPILSGAAATGLAALMLGAVVTHIFIQPPWFMAAIPGTLALIFGLVARARRNETRRLISVLSRK